MNRINLRDIPEQESRSPRGKFHSWFRDISVALGAPYGAGVSGGGHPFDLQVRRIPPGASVCPYHLHHVQWELFVVRAGEGTVRTPDGHHAVKTGDAFIHPPRAPHQLTNTGATNLEVLIITDNPAFDICHYPDSNKWGGRLFGRIFRLTECGYFDGEEEPLPGAAAINPPLPAAPPPPAPFAARRVSIDALPWEEWTSPKGKFSQFSRGVSVALGAKHRRPLAAGGHPFDLEYGKVPPGKTVCPFHSHGLQWECYWFLAGRGEFRAGDERFDVGPDDIVLTPPGVAHTFTNTGTDDLHYLLVTDDPAAEYGHYPDSGKWYISQPRQFVRLTAADYFDGEE